MIKGLGCLAALLFWKKKFHVLRNSRKNEINKPIFIWLSEFLFPFLR